MPQIAALSPAKGHTPVPRGISTTGPAIFSYGFRPFFLLAGLFAVLSMLAWIVALSFDWPLAGDYGAVNWHAHEMLFGYGTAALAGFMLTAIPNWTGRLPVSGMPLLGLVLTWLAGRVAMAAAGGIGVPAAIAIDMLFLPLLAFVAGREIVSGKNWKNLKILAGVAGLVLANAAFHASVVTSGSGIDASRAGVGIYVVLVALVGGRIVPSFTRNWLARQGATRLPAPFGRFDMVAIAVLLVAMISWALLPAAPLTTVLAVLAAVVNAVRLWRWRGWTTLEEPLLVILHLAYACIPLGLVTVALAGGGIVAPASALHVLTVGVIGNMTLAMMTRASRGHTGRSLTASRWTTLAYFALLLATVLRPFAELVPAHYHLLLELAGGAWLLAFGIFVAEYAPMLLRPNARSKG